MLQFTKQKKNSVAVDQVVVFSAAGTPLTAFSPEVTLDYRRMITGLQYRGHAHARTAVTSALRGEGVTYSALAMAALTANDLPSSVCLVELNWWNPGLLKQLGEATRPPKKGWGRSPVSANVSDLPHSLGVGGVLSGAATLDEALIATNMPNLSLLPAGEVPMHERASFARSTELKTLVTSLSDRFDHVILDIPALMVNSDGVALASLADAVCMIVRQGITPVNFVRQSLDEIKHLEVLGVVLNQTQLSIPRWMYNLIPQE